VEDNSLNAWISSDLGLYVIPKGSDRILPYIENVEFNWGALEFVRDTIFAGSMVGLYAIDYYHATKTFLPQAIYKVKKMETQSRRRILFLVIGGLLVFSFLVWIWRLRKARKMVELPENSRQKKNILSLEKMEKDIIENELLTVEAIAGFYETNPVQLNRIFKNFDITPGKFLKKVKMNLALKMLSEGASIGDVATKTGYSAQFLRSELKFFTGKKA